MYDYHKRVHFAAEVLRIHGLLKISKYKICKYRSDSVIFRKHLPQVVYLTYFVKVQKKSGMQHRRVLPFQFPGREAKYQLQLELVQSTRSEPKWNPGQIC